MRDPNRNEDAVRTENQQKQVSVPCVRALTTHLLPSQWMALEA